MANYLSIAPRIAPLITGLACLSIMASTTAGQFSEKGLLACWNFDEGNGEEAKDSSGNGNHGKIRGAKWSSGKIGHGLQFDGKSYVFVPHSEQLNFGAGDFTIEFWIKSECDGVWQAIGKNKLWFDNGSGWHFSAAGIPADFLFEISGEKKRNSMRLSTGRKFEWSHIAVVRDGGSLDFYINGELKFSRENMDECQGNNDNKENLYIGSFKGESMFFKGMLDEIRIYERALGADEVKSHYLITTGL